MGPFWKHFCEDVGSYGRYGGAVFVITVLAGFGLLIGLAILHEISPDHFPVIVGAIVFFVVAFIFQLALRSRRSRGRYTVQPMSREEIRRARSKLIGNQNPKKI